MSKDNEDEVGQQQQQQQRQQPLVPAAVLKFSNYNNAANPDDEDAGHHPRREYPIYLQEDWSSGIGGGLWSTGLALAHYCTTQHFIQQLGGRKQSSSTILKVLELGSGNGFLSVCLVVATKILMNSMNTIRVVATDTADHLSLMQSTIDLNSTCHTENDHRIDVRTDISVQEYVWGVQQQQQTEKKKKNLI